MESKTHHLLTLTCLAALACAGCRQPPAAPPPAAEPEPPANSVVSAPAETAHSVPTSPATTPVQPTATPQPAPAPALAPAAGEVLADLREIITSALAAGEKTVTVPPGRYRVVPQNMAHLLLEGLEDVTLVMDGVEMVCTETTRAITIKNCRNLTLRGLTIDYDPLPFTQGRIVEISEDTKRFTTEIIDGYAEPGEVNGSIEIFNPETGRLRARITHYAANCTMDGPMRAVITKARNTEEFAFERVGDIAVISVKYAPGGFQPHAIMASDSEGLVFQDITLHSGPTFGFFENSCNNSRYLRCRVERLAPESDPVVRAMPRLRSMNADAFHSKNARQGPSYEECVAFHQGDDAFAINGDFHFVTKAEGTSLRVLAKEVMRMRAGDTVQFLTVEGKRPANRRIVSIEPDGQITKEEREDLISRNLNPNMKRESLNDAYRVVLDAEAEGVGLATAICDADGIGNGFSIRNCRLGWNRSRGILVKAGRGEITGNKITGSVMSGILISPEYWWLEAGMADDLIIADNVITEGRGMGIAIVAVGGDGTLAPAGAFNNIKLINNTIEGGAQPGLLLTSIRGLVEENNTIRPDPDKELNPWEIGVWGRGGLEPEMRVNVEPAGQP